MNLCTDEFPQINVVQHFGLKSPTGIDNQIAQQWCKEKLESQTDKVNVNERHFICVINLQKVSAVEQMLLLFVFSYKLFTTFLLCYFPFNTFMTMQKATKNKQECSWCTKHHPSNGLSSEIHAYKKCQTGRISTLGNSV